MTGGIDLRITVNREVRAATVEPRRTLAEVLRDEFGLTGTHVGCEHGVCGACTVLVDGAPARSCLMLAVQADGAEVTTIEGLAPDGGMNPLQAAMWECHGFQCGFCTPGFLMQATALLQENPRPTEREVREALSGNICRCTGYQSIVDGVLRAAERTADTPPVTPLGSAAVGCSGDGAGRMSWSEARQFVRSRKPLVTENTGG